MVGLAAEHLGVLAEEAIERHGDYPALLFDGRWHSSRDLFERSRRIAAGLAELGLRPGDRVVVTMPNAPEVSVLYGAIWRAGCVVTPVMFLLSPSDLRHVVANAEARCIVTNRDRLETVEQAIKGLDSVRQVISVEPAQGSAVPLALLEAVDPLPIVGRDRDDLAALLYTGGTTGRSKGVMLSHAALSFAGRGAAATEAGLGIERELLTLPLSHSFGLVETLSAMQSEKGKVWILLQRFDAGAVLRLLQEHRAEKMQAVPSMLQLLLAQPIETFDLSSLRWVGVGGAPLRPEAVQEFKRRVPSALLIEGYGLTESATLGTSTPPEREKVRSVGPAMKGVDVRIVDSNGTPLTAGQPGEICLRSPSNMTGYWKDPSLTAETLRNGWLHTGDVGYMDEDGYLFVLDRKKDVIIRGGFNVYPRDVEDSLTEHPAVQMAAVVGRPDGVYGEEVVAFVTLGPGADLSVEELTAWAREHIGGYKYPREIRVMRSLPLTSVGKVDRQKLRAGLET